MLPAMIVPEGATDKAIKKCWVAMIHLREIGWPMACLPELERLWWLVHDKEGNLS